jgi:hypothetical protein
MGTAVRELLEKALRSVGLHGPADWFQSMSEPTVLATVAVIFFVIAGSVWGVGKITQHPDRFAIENELEVAARGGCLILILGGLGLIFMAGVTWAWRYLIG